MNRANGGCEVLLKLFLIETVVYFNMSHSSTSRGNELIFNNRIVRKAELLNLFLFNGGESYSTTCKNPDQCLSINLRIERVSESFK